LLGVLILQFLERVPDRQAVEMVKYRRQAEEARRLYQERLEAQVRQRIAELEAANGRLRAEIAERKRAARPSDIRCG
jgi:C4-dicarboxylate-specific signal transduction histidine kinase